MPRSGIWLRVFAALLLAGMPPIVMMAAALLLTEAMVPEADPAFVAVGIVVAAAAWAAMLSVVFTGGLAEDFRSFLTVAERGDRSHARGTGTEYDQLLSALDERDRQVATLALQASALPIDDRPQALVAALVSAVRLVMADPTWRCAVLDSDSPDLLPIGIYEATEDARPPAPLGDLERWASVTGARRTARHVEGPWGAFAVVDVAVSDRLRGILYAPWEGRVDPTTAEIALLSLVGQHAGTALEHSLLYARVRSQADELNRLAAVQADFLRGVTHDLQTPLTSISALAAELRVAPNLPMSVRDDLDTITHQADRLRRMVGQLLIASRLEAGAFTPQQEVFAVQPLIERTWIALRVDRPFEVVTEGVPHLAVADPDRIEQVLWALLDNAVKYSPAGSPIRVHVKPANGMLTVAVSDHGAGMDERSQARAFDQFYRSDHARRMAPDGSGIGLYAARGLLEAMGGSIWIDSAIGRGTTITLAISAEPSHETGDSTTVPAESRGSHGSLQGEL